MKKNFKVSIGITAYNEALNIKKLLKSLLGQDGVGFDLLEIIVVSDGSTDRTVEKVRSIKNKKIILIDESKRIGKSGRLNQIFNLFRGDVLFLCDGDILVKDRLLLSKIITSVNFKKTGLIGVNTIPCESEDSFQAALRVGHMMSLEISKNWNNGRNYLSFRGCFLGLDSKFAKSIVLSPALINNDAYLYFKAVELGYVPEMVESASVLFYLPKTFSDHLKQSSRFKVSRRELDKYFDLDFGKEYDIPIHIYMLSLMKFFLKDPISVSYYILINFVTQIKKERRIKSTWKIALSTKK